MNLKGLLTNADNGFTITCDTITNQTNLTAHEYRDSILSNLIELRHI